MTQRSTAITDATTIKNEVSAGANTATRVGNNLLEIATNAAFTEDVGTSIAPLTSGFARSCNSRTRVSEDWLLITAVPTNAVVTPGGIQCDVSGGSGTFLTNTVTERGYLRYSTGASSTGFYGFVCGGGNNKSVKLQTSDGYYFAVRTAIAALSDATNTYTAFHGLTSGTEALGNDALVAIHDRATDASHWVFRMVAGGTPTNIVSTVTITPAQIYLLEIVKLAGSNTVTCYIDGVSVGTFTLASPTAIMQMASYIVSSASTNPKTTDVDWLEWQITEPTKRASSFLP